MKYHFSEPVIHFHNRKLPAPGRPAGYAALIHAHDLQAPLPRMLWGIGTRHRAIRGDGWHLLTPRHAPQDSLQGQLTFALKWEGVNLAVLSQLFRTVPADQLASMVIRQPTGRYARRVWFLYEWLTGDRLNLPDASRGAYVDAIDPRMQIAIAGQHSSRHRVRNNLPGTPEFCPLVFRSETLEELGSLDLSEEARKVVAQVPADLLARAAAFMLLDDSKSSFAIEGERPPASRIERWSLAMGQAGRYPLDLEELLRLQRLVIGDARFVSLGLRHQGGFVGEHARDTRLPIPSHISARHDDLQSLLGGLIAFDGRTAQGMDPIVAAACIAFGFVYIHPFVDGNGRIHRYLIHHVLARRGVTPPGMVFPVSSAILRDIETYRHILSYTSDQMLPLIHWEPTQDGNVNVLNDTADLYRFFDATAHAEFLYKCVRTTIEIDLPRETSFLQAYDRFASEVQQIVDMPDVVVNLLFRFLQQNQGTLSKRARTREFSALTSEEVSRVERLYSACFDGEST